MIRKFLSVLLVSAIALLPLTTQADLRPASRRQLDAFKANCVQNVENGNTAALITDFRKTYRVPYDSDVSVSISTEPPVIYPTSYVEGCMVLVVIISVVVWGVIIYIIYKICTRPTGGGTNTNN
jgi:hypothetical protein